MVYQLVVVFGGGEVYSNVRYKKRLNLLNKFFC